MKKTQTWPLTFTRLIGAGSGHLSGSPARTTCSRCLPLPCRARPSSSRLAGRRSRGWPCASRPRPGQLPRFIQHMSQCKLYSCIKYPYTQAEKTFCRAACGGCHRARGSGKRAGNSFPANSRTMVTVTRRSGHIHSLTHTPGAKGRGCRYAAPCQSACQSQTRCQRHA